MSAFLDFNTRANGKTYHYIRIMAYHGIPLVVHNLEYRKRLIWYFNEHLKDTAFIDEPRIYSIQQPHLYLDLYVKAIIDDPITIESDRYGYYGKFEWYTADEIRDIVFEDFKLGGGWMYEL